MTAIDPKGARIEELEKLLTTTNLQNIELKKDLNNAQRHELER
jgi:hypothetical protein